MIQNATTIAAAVDYLNSLAEADRTAVEALIEHRVLCNDALRRHPTCQAGGTPVVVGMLGVINGLFGTDERGGVIAAVMQIVCTGECNGNVHTPADGQGADLPCRICGGALRYDLIRFADLGRRSPFTTPEQLGAEAAAYLDPSR